MYKIKHLSFSLLLSLLFSFNLLGITVDYGDRLFNGNFIKEQQIFNPNYKIHYKDKILINIWGELNQSLTVSVDSKGNIYIPELGVFNVIGNTNAIVQKKIAKKLKELYKKNIYVYTNLVNYQKINVYIGGNVKKPGIYSGFPNDIIIKYLDKAKGLTKQGSYRNIEIKRNNKIIDKIDLYAFLNNGNIPDLQLSNGDVIFVPSCKEFSTIEANTNSIKYQITDKDNQLTKIINDIGLVGNNKAFIERHDTDTDKYISEKIDKLKDIKLFNLDIVKLFKEKSYTNIKIHVKDEINNKDYFTTVKYKNTFKQLMYKISLLNDELANVRIYRKSVAQRQKKDLDLSLDMLEKNIYSSTSRTFEESNVRDEEVKRIRTFIQKARSVKPKGQIVISSIKDLADLKLEDEDTVVIAKNNRIVNIVGQVNFPNTFSIKKNTSLKQALKWTGGLSDTADADKIFVLNNNGFVTHVTNTDFILPNNSTVFVMKKIDSKLFLMAKDIVEVVYKIALSSSVILTP